MPRSVKHKSVNIKVETLGANGYHVFLRVTINGISCRFLLDTGASKSVVDKKFFETKFGKKSVRVIKQQTAGLHSSTAESYVATAKKFEVGGYMANQFDIALVDLHHVNSTYKHLKIKAIKGILGSDVLLESGAVIDYKTQKLSFHSL